MQNESGYPYQGVANQDMFLSASPITADDIPIFHSDNRIETDDYIIRENDITILETSRHHSIIDGMIIDCSDENDTREETAKYIADILQPEHLKKLLKYTTISVTYEITETEVDVEFKLNVTPEGLTWKKLVLYE